MNPSLSLIFALIYSLLIALRESFTPLDLLPIVFLMWLHRHVLGAIFKRLLLAQTFLLFLAASVWLLGSDGQTALLILLRSSLIVSFNLLLFWQRDGLFIYRGFFHLRFPAPFLSLLFFAVKQIEILRSELSQLTTALKARNFRKTTSMHTYRTFANLIGMLLYRSFYRAEQLSDALRTRHYQGKVYLLRHEPVSWKESWLGAAIGLQSFYLLAVTL